MNPRVRFPLTTLAGIVCVLMFGGNARANAPVRSLEHYERIAERNAFRLQPPPPPAKPPAPPAPKVFLTGITTILGRKLALFEIVAAPSGRPGERVQPESFILTEGQRGGPLEVVAIDEHAGSVRVRDDGGLMTLTLEKDGPKLPATPPPVVMGTYLRPSLNPPNRFGPYVPANRLIRLPGRN